jgi:hypothetical protein
MLNSENICKIILVDNLIHIILIEILIIAFVTRSHENFKKGKIRISGIATFRRHSLPTQPRRREEERAWFMK